MKIYESYEIEVHTTYIKKTQKGNLAMKIYESYEILEVHTP